MPANTAPLGHTCPTCYDQIFPPSNLISPVADVLRNRLRSSTWGRDELGLVLVRSYFSVQKLEIKLNLNLFPQLPDTNFDGNSAQNLPSNYNNSHKNVNSTIKNKSSASNSVNNEAPKQQHSVLSIEPSAPTYFPATNSRRPLLSRESPIGGSDRDDNKYKRRTPAEIFNRWSR